jgi:hypothetical protein
MADARLTPQDLKGSSVAVTRNALATADTYQVLLSPGGTTINFIKTGAGAATITVVTPGTDGEGNVIANLLITVAAVTGDVARKFFPEDYANAAGDLEFTTSEETAITAAVFQR